MPAIVELEAAPGIQNGHAASKHSDVDPAFDSIPDVIAAFGNSVPLPLPLFPPPANHLFTKQPTMNSSSYSTPPPAKTKATS